MIEKNNLLGEVLGLDHTETVIVTIGEWTEHRAMMTKNDSHRFRQVREAGDSEWLVTDFITPETDDWHEVQCSAYELGLQVPFVIWSGPVNQIPDSLLRSDAPLMVRCVDSPGWINLRREAKDMTEETGVKS